MLLNHAATAALFIMAVVQVGVIREVAADDLGPVDGIYINSRTYIDRSGEERMVLPCGDTILELKGNRFRFWFSGDRINTMVYPVEGDFSTRNEVVILETDQLHVRRYVFCTVKGVIGLWTEEGLRQWETREQTMTPAILVRVTDTHLHGDVLGSIDLEKIRCELVHPSIKPLYDLAAVKEFWKDEDLKYERRYDDLLEPLRTILRERSHRDDGDMVRYKQLIRRVQLEIDPILIEQIVKEMKSGPNMVVAPATLRDIYLPSPRLEDAPAFTNSRESHEKALQILVDAIPTADDSRSLTALMLVFVEASGGEKMGLTVGDQTLLFEASENGTRYKTFAFRREIADACQDWADSRLRNMDWRKTEIRDALSR